MKQLINCHYAGLTAILSVLIISLDLLDISVMNIVLPGLVLEFRDSASRVQWIITSYLLGMAITMPLSGWASEHWGHKQAFLVSLIVFTVSSALCALAGSVPVLSLFRLVQGAGGGLLMPVCMALLFNAYGEKQRVRASVIFSLSASAVPAAAPVVGGYITVYGNWNYIFWLSTAVATFALILAVCILKSSPEQHKTSPDYTGLAMGTISIVFTVYSLTEGLNGPVWIPVILLCGAVLLMRQFILRSLNSTVNTGMPVLRFELFRHRNSRLCAAVMFFGALAASITLFVIPFLLQLTLKYSSLESGYVMAFHAFGVIAGTLLAGRYISKTGSARLLCLGMLGMAFCTLGLIIISDTPSSNSVSANLFVSGIMFGLTIVPLQTLPFRELSVKEITHATTLIGVIRLLAMTTGAALGSAGLSLPVISAMNVLYMVTLLLAVIFFTGGFMVSLKLLNLTMANT
ncbi:MFS transporter [Klebsiella pneumoniae]|uniref:MFS transporter n=1 Tax=Klebsiella pneumoniae TaxID=573 RepID=UPI0021E7D11C|nr:MFS transporter [Klebsiella pneumoniae]